MSDAALLERENPARGGKAAIPDPLKRRNLIVDPGYEREMVEMDILTCEAEMSRYRDSDRRRAVAGLHPVTFGRVYFPEWMPKESPDFHYEIIASYLKDARTAVAAPVGSAKTTVLTKLCSLYSVFFEDWVEDILIISSAAELASIWLDDMSRRCKANSELVADFGEFWGQHWGSTELEFVFPSKGRGGVTQARHKFIRVLGKGGALRGRRPDRIIIDDPEDEASIRSEKQRDDFREWLWGPVINRLDAPHKKLTYIGTCIDPDAFLVSIINRPPPGWIVRAYAMLDDEGKSIWEEKYPTWFLKQRREEIGEVAFQKDFQNNPVRNWHQNVFDGSKVKFEIHSPQPDDIITMTIDPAYAKGGDHWAIIVVAVDAKGRWYVLDAEKEQTGTEGWLAKMWDLRERYPRLYKCGIESGGGQKALEYAVEQYMRTNGFSMNVEWLKHSHQSGRKGARIANLTGIVHSGDFHIAPHCAALMREIQSYKAGMDDQDDHLLDALAMQLEVQMAKKPSERPNPTPEEIRHNRFIGYESRWKQARRARAELGHGVALNRWDRYIGLGG